MKQLEFHAILQNQRKFFGTGATLPVQFRIEALQKIQAYIKQNEKEITDALTADLGKSALEGFMCEAGLVLSEISYMLKNIKKFAADEKQKTCITNFAAKSFLKKSPRGVVLIMSPWNYPFLLTLEPLVDALAAGNTAVLPPVKAFQEIRFQLPEKRLSILPENIRYSLSLGQFYFLVHFHDLVT